MFSTFIASHSTCRKSEMDIEKPLAGGAQIINIDGLKIRQIREEKGLTQLYVSTVVGVTTDTISRWENRRYPTIKKENAIRLAEALEVSLENIIDSGKQTAEEAIPPPQHEKEEKPYFSSELPPPAPEKTRSRQAIGILLGIAFIAALIITAWSWWNASHRSDNQVSAFRTIPAHIQPGEPFPVIIEVTTSSAAPFSLILKETLPPRCRPVGGTPPFVAQEGERQIIKWIGKVSGDYAAFSYLAKLDTRVPLDTAINFSGGITLRSSDQNTTPVSGANSTQTSQYHWADSNSDGRIDDEEILSVYDTYGAIEGFEFDQKRIEEIWSGKGYLWSPANRTFEILP